MPSTPARPTKSQSPRPALRKASIFRGKNSPQSQDFVGMERLEERTLMSADTATVWAAADGGNDHLYEAVLVEAGLSWDDARAQAEAMGGTLVTITSQEENDFVFGLINDSSYWFQIPGLSVQSNGPWIGAFRPDNAPAGLPLDQGWEWVTGEAFTFDNFASNEPNRISEQYLHFAGRGEVIADTWANALNFDSNRPVLGFVVEYEAAPPPPNEAPTFVGEFSADAIAGTAFEMTVSATDPEGDALSFSAESLPFWLQLTDNGDGTSTLSGTAGFVDVGVNNINLSVTDGENIVNQQITISVAEPAPEPDPEPTPGENQGSVSGVLFRDINFNGVQDDGEASLAGWTMYNDANGNGMHDEGEASTVTDDDGHYMIQGLVEGEHDIRAAAPIDESALENIEIKYRERRVRVTASLGDADHFRRTDLGGGSFLYEFESGDDDLFDEVAMRIDHNDNGEVSVTLLDKASRSRVQLRGAETRGRINLFTGRSATLRHGMIHTNGSVQTVSVAAGENTDGVDFGVAERSDFRRHIRKLIRQFFRCFLFGRCG